MPSVDEKLRRIDGSSTPALMDITAVVRRNCHRLAMLSRFHLPTDTGTLMDDEGAELPDIGAASSRAIRIASDILAEEAGGGRVPPDWSIVIIDDAGETQAVVRFADTVPLH